MDCRVKHGNDNRFNMTGHRRTGLRDAPLEAGHDNRELGAMSCGLIGSWVSLPHDGGRGQLA
jgi:hypothetical protein